MPRRKPHGSPRADLGLFEELPPDLYAEAYRPPSNELERAVWQSLMDDGMLVLKRGWPDLAVIDPYTMRMSAVEVKSESDQLRPAQKVILRVLSNHEIPAYVYKDGLGFVPVGDSPRWRQRGQTSP